MNLSEKLTELRRMRKMSQEELAEKLNVSRQTVSRWETGTVLPDAYNILELSKLFGVTADYLLNDDYKTDDDLPQIREVRRDNRVLHLNLTKAAIIVQTAFLNAAMYPYGASGGGEVLIEIIIKLLPILLASAWMAHNLRYERDGEQFRQNVVIELMYCAVQSGFFLVGFISKIYWLGTSLLVGGVMLYIFFIGPRYMNRPYIYK